MSGEDYTGEYVTAANFYAVLLGSTSALTGGSGKVLATKPQDKVFIYYTDHGGPGILGMPNLPFIYANDFINVLKAKHAMGTYSEMVIYVEACESGSIFEGLIPENLNIYVTTASNATESSWGTYCPGMTPPPPKEYDTCLGDLYSISWLEDSDVEDLKTETLEDQYLKVKLRTLNNNTYEGSHVMQYGTKGISNETVSVYQGSCPVNHTADHLPSFDSMDTIAQENNVLSSSQFISGPILDIDIIVPNEHELDYTGEYVTAANFYAVLLGDASALTGGSGKVLATKPQDKIFVYYADHGGPGTLVLKTKHAMRTYSEMVIYVESCESGSIFEGLIPENLNIYVTTASNATESSWAAYCPGMTSPLPKEYDTCLGDLYSISWLEDRTLNDNPYVGSHVMQYGTKGISGETVSVYQGSCHVKHTADHMPSFDSMGVVDQREADLHSMWHMLNYRNEASDS
ncbi:hypothetical protein R6Q59_015340 [Mikania micrantha]